MNEDREWGRKNKGMRNLLMMMTVSGGGRKKNTRKERVKKCEPK